MLMAHNIKKLIKKQAKMGKDKVRGLVGKVVIQFLMNMQEEEMLLKENEF